MVELEIAFAAFGVILAGLCPIVVAELRHVKKLESRFQPGVSYYLVPRSQPWTQKLAGTATLTATPPGGSIASSTSAGNTVTVISLEATPTLEDATVIVEVKPPVTPP